MPCTVSVAMFAVGIDLPTQIAFDRPISGQIIQQETSIDIAGLECLDIGGTQIGPVPADHRG